MKRTFIATIAGLLLVSTAAMAQVEQPSQISVQGTALIAKDSTSDSGLSRQQTKSGGFLVGYSAGALIFDPTDRSAGNGIERQTKAAFVYGDGLNFDVTRNFGVRTEYRGFVYNVPDFTQNSLHLDKITHLAQPSVGFFFRY